jgi:hypothetical protein
MVPVREARNDDAFEVAEDRVEAFTVFRRARRKRIPDLARPDARQDRIAIRVLEVVGDPVGEAMRLPAEIVRITDLCAPR